MWIRKGLRLVETIVFAQDYWDKLQGSAIVFFATCIQNVSLGFKTIYTCPPCSKPILEVNEIGADDEKSVKCERCGLTAVVLNSNISTCLFKCIALLSYIRLI